MNYERHLRRYPESLNRLSIGIVGAVRPQVILRAHGRRRKTGWQKTPDPAVADVAQCLSTRPTASTLSHPEGEEHYDASANALDPPSDAPTSGRAGGAYDRSAGHWPVRCSACGRVAVAGETSAGIQTRGEENDTERNPTI